MKKYYTILYCLCCLAFSTVFGAAVYEHLAVIPQWSAAPPASLSMFQGEYGLAPGAFWQKIHLVLIILFLMTLLTTWKTPRRNHVLIPFTGYIIVILSTFTYFVPELMDIVNTPFSDNIDASLIERGQLWETLSLLRLLIIFLLIMYLFVGLTKNGERDNSAKL